MPGPLSTGYPHIYRSMPKSLGGPHDASASYSPLQFFKGPVPASLSPFSAFSLHRLGHSCWLGWLYLFLCDGARGFITICVFWPAVYAWLVFFYHSLLRFVSGVSRLSYCTYIFKGYGHMFSCSLFF